MNLVKIKTPFFISFPSLRGAFRGPPCPDRQRASLWRAKPRVSPAQPASDRHKEVLTKKEISVSPLKALSQLVSLGKNVF